jgi:LDH2 family malate/lactate/ureidoglycolate dehydrogenase
MTQHAIHSEALHGFVTRILERVGLPRGLATDAADVLVWTSLRGIDTHGIRNFKRPYVDWLREGRIKARPEFSIEHETPLSARVNGDAGLGLAAACWGMRLAIRKATAMGVGLVSMRNSQHLGAAGYYAHLATRHDLIGFCTTGYLFAQGNDTGVLPLFGRRPMLSTNPLCIAFPCGVEPPFVLNMATSVVPVNRVELIKDLGGTIPLGWGVDADGQPTTDPLALRSLLPLGGRASSAATRATVWGWWSRCSPPSSPEPGVRRSHPGPRRIRLATPRRVRPTSLERSASISFGPWRSSSSRWMR